MGGRFGRPRGPRRWYAPPKTATALRGSSGGDGHDGFRMYGWIGLELIEELHPPRVDEEIHLGAAFLGERQHDKPPTLMCEVWDTPFIYVHAFLR